MAKLDWRHWVLGAIAAFVSGGSGAVSAGFAASTLDPDHFNLAHGLTHTLALMATVFIVSGFLGLVAYFKQSPVPREWDGEDRRNGGTPPTT